MQDLGICSRRFAFSLAPQRLGDNVMLTPTMAWARAGKELLAELLEWATQPQFVYSHRWRVGDLLIYDNRGSLHRAMPSSLLSRRDPGETKPWILAQGLDRSAY